MHGDVLIQETGQPFANLNQPRWICWPNPDLVCLQGGCVHCRNSGERKRLIDIVNYVRDREMTPIHVDMERQA